MIAGMVTRLVPYAVGVEVSKVGGSLNVVESE
jgi:hypothetical protein